MSVIAWKRRLCQAQHNLRFFQTADSQAARENAPAHASVQALGIVAPHRRRGSRRQLGTDRDRGGPRIALLERRCHVDEGDERRNLAPFAARPGARAAGVSENPPNGRASFASNRQASRGLPRAVAVPQNTCFLKRRDEQLPPHRHLRFQLLEPVHRTSSRWSPRGGQSDGQTRTSGHARGPAALAPASLGRR
jgi:hypothetical protein